MSEQELPPQSEESTLEHEPGQGVEETFREYFLQYASYVITERAIPDLEDGLKPVQRRIMHSLWENEDGRYNKVANMVGHCMKYHPHGDASIYSAMVGLGQKGLLIDTQGNWGDPVTNDPAAAARYIEARLTPFAKEVVFAPHLTAHKLSYDGRNKEPILLPVRFPLLLHLGAEGIAVGLTTRVLPHNFIELLEAQKAYLRGEPFSLFPDFPTGGIMDVKDYEDGTLGSRVRVRAVIEQGPGKSLIIRQIPYGTTTDNLIDSILKSSEKGKIKVANIQDNSAAEIEIVVSFQRGVDMDKAMDALYAFSDCEISLSSNCRVISNNEPLALTVSEILIRNTIRTRELLQLDLEIQLERLERQWHLKSLVQIFVENRIYLRIEKCETWVDVLFQIDKGLEPHLKSLRRSVTEEDLIYLTEVKIRRISAWDAKKAQEELLKLDEEMAQVRHDLDHITDYTISYIDHLIETYGTGMERKTQISSFDTVQAVTVVERTERLYVEKKAGFIGTDLRDAQEVEPCSPLDDVLVILEDGGLIITKVPDRRYIGENILHTQIFGPEHRETVFNLVYEDLPTGRSFIKRFTVGGYTRDKRYELGSSDKTRILLCSFGSENFSYVKLRKKPRIKTDIFVRFDDFLVKGRGANGVLLSKHKISSAKEISETVYCNRLDIPKDSLSDRNVLPSDSSEDELEVPEVTSPKIPSRRPESLQEALAKQKSLFGPQPEEDSNGDDWS